MLELIGNSVNRLPPEFSQLDLQMARHWDKVRDLDGRRIHVLDKKTNMKVDLPIPTGYVVDGYLGESVKEKFKRRVIPFKINENENVELTFGVERIFAEKSEDEVKEQLNSDKVLFIIVPDESSEDGWSSGFIVLEDLFRYSCPEELAANYIDGRERVESRRLAILAMTEEVPDS